MRRFHAVWCPRCRLWFGIDRQFAADRLIDSRQFTCPGGHGFYYGQDAAGVVAAAEALLKAASDG